MSSNYAVLGLAMAGAGIATNAFGPRAVWLAAGGVFLAAALVALVMTSWLPITAVEENAAMEASAESAVAALGNGHVPPFRARSRDGSNGVPEPPLERIATLLEEIETRRAAEAARRSSEGSAQA